MKYKKVEALFNVETGSIYYYSGTTTSKICVGSSKKNEVVPTGDTFTVRITDDGDVEQIDDTGTNRTY